MGGSGLIFAGIVVLCLAVLVPMRLRQHDGRRVVPGAEGVSAAMRVLARRRPLPNAVAARRTRRPDVRSGAGSVRSSRRLPSAARRRRTLLLVLMLLLAGSVVLAVIGRAPIWAPVLPVLALLGYLALLLATASARRTSQRPVRRPATRRPPPARPVPQPVLAPAHGEALEPAAVPVAALAIAEPTHRPRHIAAEVEAVVLAEPGQVVEVAAAVHDPAVRDPDGWAPVPVPLPTYITAPKAPRTIRTIDLRSPGAWTSGPAHEHDAGPQPVPTPAAPDHPDDLDEDRRRAVGD